MDLYVLEEVTPDYEHSDLIGIIDNQELASGMMKDYFGTYKVTGQKFIGESSIVWEKSIDVLDVDGNPYPVIVHLTEHTLNQL